jgi:hypothetical protein
MVGEGSSPGEDHQRTESHELVEDQLRDLIDVLRRPLQGRPVLVPFGSQAFFEGTLNPMGQELHTGGEKSVGEGDHQVGVVDREREYVVLKNYGRDKKEGCTELRLTREEARDLLQSERDLLTRTSARQPKAGTRPSLPARAVTVTASPSGDTETEPSSSSTQLSETTDNNPLFFDIREELDASGNEIRSEAINVSKQLELLESESSAGGRPATDGYILKPTSDDVSQLKGSANTNSSTAQPRPMSDAEYDKLATRLDELARLEEQSDQSKVANMASRKRLQGGSWSKGFLNKPSKATATSTKKPPGDGSSAGIKATQPKAHEQDLGPAQLTGSSAAKMPSTRRVGFDPHANDVREIPRIGERSASEIRKQRPSPASMMASQQEDAAFATSAAVAGLVRERSKSSKNTAVAVSEMPAPSASDPSPPKRLSRFAQERLERQQQHQLR